MKTSRFEQLNAQLAALVNSEEAANPVGKRKRKRTFYKGATVAHSTAWDSSTNKALHASQKARGIAN